MSTREIVNQIIQSLEEKVRRTLSSVKLDDDKLQELIISAIPQPEPKKAGGGTSSDELLASLQTIRASENQKQVISNLVGEIAKHADGCGIIILGKKTSLWLGPGLGMASGEPVGAKKLPVSIGNDSLIQMAIMQGAVIISGNLTASEKKIFDALKMENPASVACVPMTINGRVQGVVLATSDKPEFDDPAAFSIMTGVATIAVEQLPFKDKIGFSNFPGVLDETGAEAEATEEEDDDDSPFEGADLSGESIEIELDQPEEQLPPVAPPPAEPVEKATPESPPASEPQQDDQAEEHITSSVAGGETLGDYEKELASQLGEVDEQESPAAEPDMSSIEIPETSSDESDDAGGVLEINTDELGDDGIDFLEQPEEIQEDQSFQIEKPEFSMEDTPQPAQAEEPAAEKAEPEPAAPPEPEEEEEIPVLQESSEPEEVEAPPSDYYESLGLGGYDLDKYSGEEKTMHEKAIRFARLLVSEIKLYNEESVKQGRENKDLMSRLKDDIQRSQVLYEQRIASNIRANTNYFHDEMVRQLADGDPSLLG